MYISQQLWVGECPLDTLSPRLHTDSAEAAATFIEVGATVIVPTREIAYETLLLLGSSPVWARRATTPVTSIHF